jgi:hypothetical protein
LSIQRLFFLLVLLTGMSVVPIAAGNAGSAASGPQAIGHNLASHKAFYTLSFSRLDPRNYRNGIAGGLSLEFANDCEAGYTLNQRFVIETNTEDGPSLSDMTLNSWEAQDGAQFRFKLKDVLNGDVDQELDGEATASEGDAGLVRFSLPEGVELALPPGILFPTQHTIRLLALAHEGKNWLQAPVYDGSSADGYTDVGGFIGSELPVEAGETPVLAPLKGLRSWRVRLAYFTSDKAQDSPDYEIGYRLYDNGVVDDIVFDYGDYAIRATLQKLEIKPKNAC